MVNIIQNGEVYEVSFRYDKYLIELVKQVPGRQWIPKSKLWTIPRVNLGMLLNKLKGTSYENQINLRSNEDINKNEQIDDTTKIPDIDISKVKMCVEKGKKPYQHQMDFMKFAIDRQNNGNLNGFLCADSAGLGKTLEAMNLALYNQKALKFKRCLIICCVNSSKYNWVSDIKKHSNGKEIPYILGSRKCRDGSIRYTSSSAEKLADLKSGYMYGKKEEKLPYFIVINIEALRYKDKNRKFPIAEEISKQVTKGKIGMIVLDEIHKNASPTSIQGKQILKIKKETGNSAMWLPMTGTPITNKPTDVFTPLRLVNGHKYTSFYKWCQEFCIYGGYGGYEIMGYKNIPYLKSLLQPNMIRRRKEEVLDLPPKIIMTEYVENTEAQKKLYQEVAADMIANRAKIMAEVNPMTRFLRLRQINGAPELVDNSIKWDDKDYISKNAKLARFLELVDDIVDRGEKVVVFSNWVEPLKTFYRYVSKKYKTCCYTGTMSTEDREKHKKTFMTNPDYKVMIGTIGALGTSHTLTVANNIIFIDEPWNPSDREQAEDRCYRIGTNSSVNIYTLITKDTVDDHVHDILSLKTGVSNYIVDGNLDLKKHPELFDFLLSDFKK